MYKKGYISIDDDVAFPKSYLAANCFGLNYSGLMKGGANHPREANKLIWFPRLYPNGEWNNSISNDEETIWEKAKSEAKRKKHIDYELQNKIKTRIVFARVKNSLGEVMYRFRGEYQLDEEESNYNNGLIWKRVATKVKTYHHKSILQEA